MSQRRSDSASATVRRWQLSEHLRQYREAAGMTIDQVVDELRQGAGKWSKSKISRIENREHNLKHAELDRLLDIYGVDDQVMRGVLHELTEKANERGWWLAYGRGLPEHFHPYLSLESAMLGLRQFETMLVPGLLQTDAYARALVNGVSPHFTPEQAERRVAGRIARQRILLREDPPELHVILDEGILERPIGGPKVMQAQLRRLVEAAESPNIAIQVLLKSIDANPGLEGPFSMLTLPEPIPDIGYTAAASGQTFVDNREQVRALTMRFGTLTQLALPVGDSIGKISAAADDFE
jgi:transcriptional regulator with XRE-family HTH domain